MVVPGSLGITVLELVTVTSSLAATAKPVSTSTGNPLNRLGRSIARIAKGCPFSS